MWDWGILYRQKWRLERNGFSRHLLWGVKAPKVPYYLWFLFLSYKQFFLKFVSLLFPFLLSLFFHRKFSKIISLTLGQWTALCLSMIFTRLEEFKGLPIRDNLGLLNPKVRHVKQVMLGWVRVRVIYKWLRNSLTRT